MGKQKVRMLSMGYAEVCPHLEVVIKFLIHLSNACQDGGL